MTSSDEELAQAAAGEAVWDELQKEQAEERLRLEWDSEEVTDCDRYERRVFGKIFHKNHKLQEMIGRGRNRINSFNGLLKDIATTLYRQDTTRGEKTWEFKEWFPESFEANKTVISELTELREYQELKAYTQNDEVAAALSLLGLNDHIIKLLPEEVKEEQEETQQKENDLLKELMRKERLQEKKEKAKDEEEKEDLDKKLKKQQKRVEKKKEALEEQEKKLKETLADNAPGIRAAARQSVKAAVEEAKDSKDGMDALAMCGAGTGDGAGMNVDDLDSRMEMARMIRENHQVREALKLVGKFRNLAVQASDSEIQTRGVNVAKISLGNDLERVLPSRLVELEHPVLKLNFLKDYTERRLPIYAPDEEPQDIFGPLVFCIDKSGSMAGQRTSWAIAFTLGAILIAQRDNRPFYAITFSDTMADLRKFDLTNGSSKEIIAFAMDRTGGGGTNFDLPINMACETIEKIEKFSKADIVFVTDGWCSIPNTAQIKSRCAAKKIRFYTVYVHGSTCPDLEKLSNKSWRLEDMLNDDKKDSEIVDLYGMF